MRGTPRVGRRLLAFAVTLAAAEAVLGGAGARLPGPVLRTAGGPSLRWTGGTDPASVVIGLVHALALAGMAYLVGAVLLEMLDLLLDARSITAGGRLVPRLPWASAVVQRAAGAGLAISVGAASTWVPTAAGGIVPSSTSGASPSAPVVMHLDADPAPPVMHLTTKPGGPVRTPTRSTAPQSAVWTIRPGDHLWKVAGLTLASAWGRPAGDAAVLAYVDAIVRANEEVFVVPGHPDLVYPGQRFVLPPLPRSGSS